MPAKRPQPRFPEPDTQPFWDATKRHELTYQICDKCNAVIFYSRRHCTSVWLKRNHPARLQGSRHRVYL